MYLPEDFQISSVQTMHESIERWNFATLITPENHGKFHITHLPLLLKRDLGRLGTLNGHMARANEHGEALAGSPKSVALFHGPHAYISPRWYRTPQTVPTWNYLVIHAVGFPRILSHDEPVEAHLRDLVQYHEGTGLGAWKVDTLSAQTLAALKGAIVMLRDASVSS